jgi:four helix bundle protein
MSACVFVKRHFSELDCWQLAHRFKSVVDRVAARPAIRDDLRFCGQLRNAAASAPRSIADGCSRRTAHDVAHALDLARTWLAECHQQLLDAVEHGYLSAQECRELLVLNKRAAAAASALQRQLRRNTGGGQTGLEPP